MGVEANLALAQSKLARLAKDFEATIGQCQSVGITSLP